LAKCCLINGSTTEYDFPDPGVPITIVPRNGLLTRRELNEIFYAAYLISL